MRKILADYDGGSVKGRFNQLSSQDFSHFQQLFGVPFVCLSEINIKVKWLVVCMDMLHENSNDSILQVKVEDPDDVP